MIQLFKEDIYPRKLKTYMHVHCFMATFFISQKLGAIRMSIKRQVETSFYHTTLRYKRTNNQNSEVAESKNNMTNERNQIHKSISYMIPFLRTSRIYKMTESISMATWDPKVIEMLR